MKQREATHVFSRVFLRVLNEAHEAPGGTPKKLGTIRGIVALWALRKQVNEAGAKYLNRKVRSNKPRVSSSFGVPTVSRNLGAGALTQEQIVATSFAEFLLEVAERGGRLRLQECRACKNFFVQEQTGRTRIFCSNQCKFRLWRKVARDPKGDQ